MLCDSTTVRYSDYQRVVIKVFGCDLQFEQNWEAHQVVSRVGASGLSLLRALIWAVTCEYEKGASW